MAKYNQVSSTEPIIQSVLIKFTLITNHLIVKVSFQLILMSFNSKIGLLSTTTCWIKLRTTACRSRLFHIRRCKIETRFWWALTWLAQKLEACSAQVNSRLCNKIKQTKYLQTVEAKSMATITSSTTRRVRAHILQATTRAKEKGRFRLRAWWKYKTYKIHSWGQTPQTTCSSTSSWTQVKAPEYIAAASPNTTATLRTFCHL